jgi:hypothetical protein
MLAKRLLSIIIAMSLLGCASEITVISSVPAPLIASMPFHAAVIIDNDLQGFQYNENIDGQANWSITVGPAAADLVRNIFTGLFAEVTFINSQEDSVDLNQIDLIVYPRLSRFEFDAPIRGNDIFAESWMQFTITAFDTSGNNTGEALITGYGRSEIFRDREGSVNEATQSALRDAGVNMIATLPNSLNL